ncbi:MAG: DNA polymerase IV [Candidatus Nanoarchaeia archaeon]
MERIIAHVDMDCFFCQCEEKKFPELKGKPIIVGSTGERGVVSAANYEARKFGVYSATPISKARQLCSDGIFLPVNKEFYVKESEKIMLTLNSISDEMEQVSVDEAYIDITSLCKIYSIEKAAYFVKDKVKQVSGMSCSVGVSNSRFVSKIASDYRKPGGITTVKDPYSFLSPLKISKIPGIGKVLQEKFHSMEIKTIGDLASMDKFRLIDNFGMHGILLQNISLGVDKSGINKKGRIKSFSRETTFPIDTSSILQIKETLEELCKAVHKDLGDFYYRTVSLKLRFSDFQTIERDISFKIPLNSLEEIINASGRLFENNCPFGKKIRLIGVRLSNISGGRQRQLTLKKFMD